MSEPVSEPVRPLITETWPSFPGNPKQPVLERRRLKAIRKLSQYQAELEMFVTLLGSRRRTVLDVACGTGFRVLELARRGYETTGLEIDPNLAVMIPGAAKHFGIPATVACGDACAIPFADDSFDAVMSSSFFEHVYDVDFALREQLRVLKPGGLLIIEDGNFFNPFLFFDLAFRYPLRTKFRMGGLHWMLTKRRVKKNLYGYLPLGRDEDVKSMWWWRRKLRRVPGVRLVEVSTTGRYVPGRLGTALYPFRGACLAVVEKRP